MKETRCVYIISTTLNQLLAADLNLDLIEIISNDVELPETSPHRLLMLVWHV